ncbi:MAG: tRNA (adenosine(37)-N6)-dimethylallyltransferase MiaA [Phocaeicola sp.]|uniref:tRNA (adenosine(37)-N6)-dimethylallyltransferase MiaA n=3 Tax=Phocaeicola sp. TaxID=2773926 RepID=UPI003F9FBEFE
MKNLIVLIGPTAVGKTDLSLTIADTFQTDIISADSRQIYKDLKIGTAAPTPKQLAMAKHHFVGILDLKDYYSAAQYESDVLKLLDNLFKEHDIQLLTGGSMMYIDAVCKGIDEIPTVDNETRQMMMKKYQKEGLEKLRDELKLLDPIHYNKVDLENQKRVIHALEICYMTGKPYSSFLTGQVKKRPFRIIKIGLYRERAELFNRVNRRVDEMMDDGLLDEVKRVYKYKELNSLNTVGYKELFAYLDGQWPLGTAVEKIKRNTRIYAKKQMTWFKRDADIHWFHPEQKKEILQYIKDTIH